MWPEGEPKSEALWQNLFSPGSECFYSTTKVLIGRNDIKSGESKTESIYTVKKSLL